MSVVLDGYTTLDSDFEFLHVEFTGIKIHSVGIALGGDLGSFIHVMEPEKARKMAQDLLRILGDQDAGPESSTSAELK